MILTDDNFGTLVHAVELGRRVYDKIIAYVRYQMTQLLSLIMLFVAATAFKHQRGCRADAVDDPVPVDFRHCRRCCHLVHGSRGSRCDEPAAARPEGADHQSWCHHDVAGLRIHAVRSSVHPYSSGQTLPVWTRPACP